MEESGIQTDGNILEEIRSKLVEDKVGQFVQGYENIAHSKY